MNLKEQLQNDIKKLGLPTDYKLELRGYSIVYDGRYDPNKKLVIIYTRYSDNTVLKYSFLFDTLLHEVIHHYQWCHDPTFVRHKGVMHNPQFYALKRWYKLKAFSLQEKGEVMCYIDS